MSASWVNLAMWTLTETSTGVETVLMQLRCRGMKHDATFRAHCRCTHVLAVLSFHTLCRLVCLPSVASWCPLAGNVLDGP
eukprot:5360554-Amphidinium_carterae.2